MKSVQTSFKKTSLFCVQHQGLCPKFKPQVTHLRESSLHPAGPTGEGEPGVVQGGVRRQHVALRDGLSEVLVADLAGERERAEAAVPGLLDSHVHCSL